MSNYFRRKANEIRHSGGIVVIYIIFALMTLIGLGLSFEDISTSYWGYTALPTAKTGEWVAYLVALAPWVGQIAGMYLYLSSDGEKRWAGAMFLALHVVDVGTDVVYKMQGDWSLFIIALLESELIFSIMSELFLTTGATMLIELWPDFAERLNAGGMLARFGGAMEGAVRASGAMRGDEDGEDDEPPVRRPIPQGQGQGGVPPQTRQGMPMSMPGERRG